MSRAARSMLCVLPMKHKHTHRHTLTIHLLKCLQSGRKIVDVFVKPLFHYSFSFWCTHLILIRNRCHKLFSRRVSMQFPMGSVLVRLCVLVCVRALYACVCVCIKMQISLKLFSMIRSRMGNLNRKQKNINDMKYVRDEKEEQRNNGNEEECASDRQRCRAQGKGREKK